MIRFKLDTLHTQPHARARTHTTKNAHTRIYTHTLTKFVCMTLLCFNHIGYRKIKKLKMARQIFFINDDQIFMYLFYQTLFAL